MKPLLDAHGQTLLKSNCGPRERPQALGCPGQRKGNSNNGNYYKSFLENNFNILSGIRHLEDNRKFYISARVTGTRSAYAGDARQSERHRRHRMGLLNRIVLRGFLAWRWISGSIFS